MVAPAAAAAAASGNRGSCSSAPGNDGSRAAAAGATRKRNSSVKTAASGKAREGSANCDHHGQHVQQRGAGNDDDDISIEDMLITCFREGDDDGGSNRRRQKMRSGPSPPSLVDEPAAGLSSSSPPPPPSSFSRLRKNPKKFPPPSKPKPPPASAASAAHAQQAAAAATTTTAASTASGGGRKGRQIDSPAPIASFPHGNGAETAAALGGRKDGRTTLVAAKLATALPSDIKMKPRDADGARKGKEEAEEKKDDSTVAAAAPTKTTTAPPPPQRSAPKQALPTFPISNGNSFGCATGGGSSGGIGTTGGGGNAEPPAFAFGNAPFRRHNHNHHHNHSYNHQQPSTTTAFLPRSEIGSLAAANMANSTSPATAGGSSSSFPFRFGSSPATSNAQQQQQQQQRSNNAPLAFGGSRPTNANEAVAATFAPATTGAVSGFGPGAASFSDGTNRSSDALQTAYAPPSTSSSFAWSRNPFQSQPSASAAAPSPFAASAAAGGGAGGGATPSAPSGVSTSPFGSNNWNTQQQQAPGSNGVASTWPFGNKSWNTHQQQAPGSNGVASTWPFGNNSWNTQQQQGPWRNGVASASPFGHNNQNTQQQQAPSAAPRWGSGGTSASPFGNNWNTQQQQAASWVPTWSTSGVASASPFGNNWNAQQQATSLTPAFGSSCQPPSAVPSFGFSPSRGANFQQQANSASFLTTSQYCSPFDADGMTSTAVGKAWALVEAILKLMNSNPPPFTNQGPVASPVAEDDMLWLAEKLIRQQEKFARSGIPTTVDIGYHWTRPDYLNTIRTHGLLSKAARDKRQIDSKHNGSIYGEGIYTANDPYKFFDTARYGTVGLIVARLKGKVSPILTNREELYRNERNMAQFNTILGRGGAMQVLRRSSQCVPLVRFNHDLLSARSSSQNGPGDEVVFEYHFILQQLLDRLLNNGKETPVLDALSEMNVPSVGTLASLRAKAKAKSSFLPQTQTPFGGTVVSNAQRSNAFGAKQSFATTNKSKLAPEILHYTAPASLQLKLTSTHVESIRKLNTAAAAAECPICFCSLGIGEAVALKVCRHEFHKQCIQNALSQCDRRCPICRLLVCEPVGKMPSGSMKISSAPLVTCMGHQPGTIIIEYAILAGVQKQWHDSPGASFPSTTRKAYLPDSDEGRDLLKRLKYAFSHGLTFTIGTSTTRGISDVVTWASIHHKTRPSYSSDGHCYPDPGYFYNANEELDNLRVPAARDLP